jgi:hypothetical protein
MIQRLIPIVIVIAAIGLFFVYTSPAYTGPVTAARLEVESLNGALKAADAFKERESQLLAERDALPAADLARLEAFLPNNVNNIQLILDLDALASRSGVRLSNFNVGEQASDGSAATTGDESISLESTSAVGFIDITLTAEGTYGAFRTFIKATEQSLRMLDLVSLNIEGSSTGVYTYDMTFRIYWLQ